MITRVRQYAKKEPSRDAHKLHVICEGAHDEPKYFEFFEGLSSNLNVITIPSEAGKTDPVQLERRAMEKFDFECGCFSLDYSQGDRIWFVIDTDAWALEGKIAVLRDFCKKMNEDIFTRFTEIKPYCVWNVAQSNPCFEIWLYYHFYRSAPAIKEVDEFASFKQFVDSKINGGFKYESDPVRLKDAIANAEANFGHGDNEAIALFSTELMFLGKEINNFVSVELAKLCNKMG